MAHHARLADLVSSRLAQASFERRHRPIRGPLRFRFRVRCMGLMVQPGAPRRSRRAEKRQSVKHTEMCAFFVEGKCTRGNRCTFAHGVDQLRPRPDLFKTRLCSSYQMFMRCPYGESCTHAHGIEELRLPHGEVLPSSGRPIRYPYSESCTLAHGIEELRLPTGIPGIEELRLPTGIPGIEELRLPHREVLPEGMEAGYVGHPNSLDYKLPRDQQSISTFSGDDAELPLPMLVKKFGVPPKKGGGIRSEAPLAAYRGDEIDSTLPTGPPWRSYQFL